MLDRRFWLFMILCGLIGSVQAHEVRPGYLELREVDTRSWDVLWKVPAKDKQRLGLYVQMPGDCTNSDLRSAPFWRRRPRGCARVPAGRSSHTGSVGEK